MRVRLLVVLLMVSMASSAFAQPETSSEAPAAPVGAPENVEVAASPAPEPPVAEPPIVEAPAAAAPAASEGAVPGVPPGTPVVVYVQAPHPREAAIRAEIEFNRARMAEHRLGGPIAVLAVGGAVALTSAYLFLIFQTSYYDDGYADYERSARIAGITALVGGAVATAGLVMLLGALNRRKPYKARIRALREELRRETTFAPAPVALPGGFGMTLSSRF